MYAGLVQPHPPSPEIFFATGQEHLELRSTISVTYLNAELGLVGRGTKASPMAALAQGPLWLHARCTPRYYVYVTIKITLTPLVVVLDPVF